MSSNLTMEATKDFPKANQSESPCDSNESVNNIKAMDNDSVHR